MHLTRTDDLAAEVDALAARHGGRAGIDAVLGGLDRRLRRTVAPCRSPHRAWTWDRADRRDPDWWPQGVSVEPGGHRIAVSWYAKDGGSRVSFLDLDARRYGHVTLVRPTADGHEPLRVHAGGIAWHGTHVYVAATKAGVWVCDTADITRSPEGELLPVRQRLSLVHDDDSEPFRFSFVGIDSAVSPPRLVAGEYGNRSQSRRILHVGIEDDSVEVSEGGVVRAQGVATVDGVYYLTASHGPWGLGSVWSGPPGALREHRWALPMGPEDVAHDPATDRLWTVTEHPGRRWIVAIQRSRVG